MGKPAVKKKPLPKGVVAVDVVVRVYVDQARWVQYWKTQEDMSHQVPAAHIQHKMSKLVLDRLEQLGVRREIEP